MKRGFVGDVVEEVSVPLGSPAVKDIMSPQLTPHNNADHPSILHTMNSMNRHDFPTDTSTNINTEFDEEKDEEVEEGDEDEVVSLLDEVRCSTLYTCDTVIESVTISIRMISYQLFELHQRCKAG